MVGYDKRRNSSVPVAPFAFHHELKLPSWQEWSARDPLQQRAVEQMVLGVSTRRYARSLEPLPEAITARGISKSAVSERFVYANRASATSLISIPSACQGQKSGSIVVPYPKKTFADSLYYSSRSERQGFARALGPQAESIFLSGIELLSNVVDRPVMIRRLP